MEVRTLRKEALRRVKYILEKRSMSVFGIGSFEQGGELG